MIHWSLLPLASVSDLSTARWMLLLRGFSLLISLFNRTECLILLEVMNAHLPFISMGNTHPCMWCLRMRHFGIIGFSLFEIRNCVSHQNKIIYILWEWEETVGLFGGGEGGSWIQMKFYGPVDLLIAPQVLSVLKLNLNIQPSPLYLISTSLPPTIQQRQMIWRGAVTYCLPNRSSSDLS